MKKSDFQTTSRFAPNWATSTSLVLISVLIFSIPSNLFLKCCAEVGYVNGLFVDYLIPKLYLFNLVAVALVLFWVIGNRQRIFQNLILLWQRRRSPMTTKRWLMMLILGLWVMLGIRQCFAPNVIAALWWYGQATLNMTVGLILIDIFRHIDQSRYSRRFWQSITLILIITIIFQSSVAFFQSTQQRSLTGYRLLGEPNLSQPLGLAKTVTSAGQVIVLPYGTTAHPNVLAGCLSLFLILIYLIQVRRKPVSSRVWWVIWSILLLFGTTTILLTQSISGALTLIIGLIAIFVVNRYQHNLAVLRRHSGLDWQSQYHRFHSIWLVVAFLIFTLILLPLLIHFLSQQLPDNPSLVRRAHLQSIARLATIDQPLFGLGSNNFTTQMEQYGRNAKSIRFVQPVHHVGWLWISETGMLGMLFLIALLTTLFIRTNQSSFLIKIITLCFLTLTPILVLDHYLLSLPSGIMLMITYVAFFSFLIGSKPRITQY